MRLEPAACLVVAEHDRAHGRPVQRAVGGDDAGAECLADLVECRLPPAADANLHIVVADLVHAADVLQGRTKMKPQRGTAIASRATEMYATYFDHPGWKPVH